MSSSRTTNVREEVTSILGWPTDTVAVDFVKQSSAPSRSPRIDCPHTIIIFIPGNPGCVGWYTRNLLEIVQRLGQGFAARGISYAGHSADESMTNVEARLKSGEYDGSIPWTIDGQILHKNAYVDHVLAEYRSLKGDKRKSLPRFIFMAHSIGCHMVERLCVLRPDILSQTVGLIHLMPFIRMKPLPLQAFPLNLGAASPDAVISITRGIMYILKSLPKPWLDGFAKLVFEDETGRDLVVQLLRQPTYSKNFFELGMEELRDVPESVDVRTIALVAREQAFIRKSRILPLTHNIQNRFLLFVILENLAPYQCYTAERITGDLFSIKMKSKI